MSLSKKKKKKDIDLSLKLSKLIFNKKSLKKGNLYKPLSSEKFEAIHFVSTISNIYPGVYMVTWTELIYFVFNKY